MTRTLLLFFVLALPAFAQDEPSSLPELKGEAKARIQNLDQYLEDWDLESAKAELAALEKLAPADVEPLAYYQGRIAFEEGRYADAQRLLEKAGLTDKPGSWVRLAKDTEAIIGNTERAESAHFVFLYPKGKDAVLVPWALEALEAIRAALEKDLGYAQPGKIRVEIVSSAGELAKVSTLSKEAIKTTGTIAICKFNKLMVTSPKAVVTGYDWLDTVTALPQAPLRPHRHAAEARRDGPHSLGRASAARRASLAPSSSRGLFFLSFSTPRVSTRSSTCTGSATEQASRWAGGSRGRAPEEVPRRTPVA